eukprot:TRINITY_DN9828_c0_g1_i1.p1 TRINITY_DN9828_c0_g1~~TRINITY_DN9828_c0_g1_i1.p1  ORF type:complete len:791 (-),score=256.53 TRINITY_DN9828_c0_g1_i1:56-2428(-)
MSKDISSKEKKKGSLVTRKPSREVSRENVLIYAMVKEGDIKGLTRALTDIDLRDSSNLVDTHGQTPLHVAALEGKIEVVKFLLQQGASVDAKDKNHWTPLHCSASTAGNRTQDHLEICVLFLRAGANPNAVTETNTSVIHYLVRYPYSAKLIDVLQLAREKGADIDVVEGLGDTPLHQAAFKGCPESCAFLIQSGAGVNATNMSGETPLHMAVRGGQVAVVSKLLEFGADPYIIGDNGTAREVAFLSNNQEIIDVLDEQERILEVNGGFGAADSLSFDEDFAFEVPAIDTVEIPETTQSMLHKQLSTMIPKTDGFEAYNLSLMNYEADTNSGLRKSSTAPQITGTNSGGSAMSLQNMLASNTVAGHAPAMGGLASQTTRVVLRKKDGKTTFIMTNSGFNLELGTHSKVQLTNDLSLEYTDEYDDFYYLIHFVKDPAQYLSVPHKDTDADLESHFRKHLNIVGEQDAHLVVISILVEPDTSSLSYRGLLRARTGDKTFWLSQRDFEREGKAPKEISEKAVLKTLVKKYEKNQEMKLEKLVAIKDPAFCKSLVDLDSLQKVQNHKFGVIYCRGNQTEETVFADENGSPAFEEFLAFLGQKVELKGWKGYKGDLDVRNGATGEHSYHAKWKHLEVMFEVSQFLPKERRKAIIGNTVVSIVFQDGGCFDPGSITSQVLHVVLVVQPMKDSKGTPGYRIGVASKKGVPRFRPSLPLPSFFEKNGATRELIFHKLINGERAAYHCSSKARRQVRSLVEIVQQTRGGQMEYAVSKAIKDLPQKDAKKYAAITALLKK